jgi:hypothetical protein
MGLPMLRYVDEPKILLIIIILVNPMTLIILLTVPDLYYIPLLESCYAVMKVPESSLW